MGKSILAQKIFSVQSLLWLSLMLALAGSLRHLAAMFGSIDQNNFYGYLSAIAVDAGLFSLSYSIRQRKAQNRKITILWIGIILFSAISIYGNLAYGILATNQTLPPWMNTSRPYILAASLPVLVLYLAELVSDNHHQKPIEKPATPHPLYVINQKRRKQKNTKLGQLAAAIIANPDANNTQLAQSLNISRGTVRNYKAEITTNGNH
jgi:hypothetical protein